MRKCQNVHQTPVQIYIYLIYDTYYQLFSSSESGKQINGLPQEENIQTQAKKFINSSSNRNRRLLRLSKPDPHGLGNKLLLSSTISSQKQGRRRSRQMSVCSFQRSTTHNQSNITTTDVFKVVYKENVKKYKYFIYLNY